LRAAQLGLMQIAWTTKKLQTYLVRLKDLLQKLQLLSLLTKIVFQLKKKKTFKSKLEVSVAELLDTVGCKYVYEGEQVPYTIQHNYNPDFVLLNGVMLETKGYWDSEDRRKIKAVIRDNPHLDIRMVFQAPFNKISKKSKTTYAQWCEKHNIKWAAAHAIPIDWLR